MVFLLRRDVFDGFFHSRLTYREASVAALPSEGFIIGVYRLDPATAVAFHIFHEFGQGYVFRQGAQYVDVVFHSADLYGCASQGFQDRSDISVKMLEILFSDGDACVFDVKRRVDVEF